MNINAHQLIGRNCIGSSFKHLLFIIFYILSVRSVLVYLNYLTGSVQLFAVISVLFGLAICWWRTVWILYLFVASIPLISGIQELGFLKSVPLLSFAFSIIYISWFSKFIFFRKGFRSEKTIVNLIDILIGFIILSLIASFCLYPLDYSLYRLQYASIMGQSDPFWFMESGYIVLQGMFLYRMFGFEAGPKTFSRFAIPCLYFHGVTVLAFAFGELIKKVVEKQAIDIIYSPFQDPHSFGGYLLILFFCFFSRIFGKSYFYIEILLASSLLFFIFLSGSTATVLCLILAGIIWSLFSISKLRNTVFRVGFILALIVASYSIIELVPNTDLIKKYKSELNYTQVLKLATVTERFELWDQAMGIIKEYPLTGSGIGSFFKISNNYSFKGQIDSGERRNAHNYYFQFAAELGLPALVLFLLILFFTYRAGIQLTKDGQRTGLLFGLFAYLLSLLSGHHLLLSTHQFLFWFILFVIASPMDTDLEETKSVGEKRYLSKILCLLVCLAISAHAFNSLYLRKEIKGLYEFGLYKPQIVNALEMRWAGKVSRAKVQAESDYFGFSIYAEPENLSSGVLVLEIYANDKLIEQLLWARNGYKNQYYHIPGIKNQALEIKMIASETFNPYKDGLNGNIKENRNQSVAITEISFFTDSNFRGFIFHR